VNRPTLVALVFGALALYALPSVIGTLGIRTAIEILYFALFAASFNLLFGYAGLLSFGFNATFGVGAYAMALLLLYMPGIGLVLAALLSVAIGAAAGAVIGALCVRLHGGYFSLLTLAFCQFLLAIALKWRTVTKGEDGVIVAAQKLDIPGIGEVRLDVAANMYWLTLTVVLVCLWLMWRFTRTPLGRSVVLVRENEERASFISYNVYAVKVLVFTLASGMAAVAGVLYVLFQRLAAPGTLGLGTAGDVLFMTVLGGTGSFLGPVLGAGIYHLLQNWLSKTTEHWAFFIGLLFVLLVIFAPGGISGLMVRARNALRDKSSGKSSSHETPPGTTSGGEV